MAYSEELADRIAEYLDSEPNLKQQKMFGGVGFLLNGHMAVGVSGDSLMARVGAESYESALEEPGVEVLGKTGRPMRGWVLVTPSQITSDEGLAYWIDRGRVVASALPPK
jgi:TfoX/Sxy family transcriptional regulator of competence genes